MARSVSIRARLLLLMLAVTLPACAAGLWAIVLAYQDEQAAVQDNLLDTTRALSMVVDAEVARREAIAVALAADKALDAAPELGPAQLEEFAQRARAAMKGLRGWVELRSAQGLLVSTRTPGGGVAGGDMGPAPAGRPLASRATYEPLTRDTSSGQWFAALVHPVQRKDQTVLNLSVTIMGADLQNIVESQRLPGGWRASVMDTNRVVVARVPADASYIGLPVPTGFQQRLDGGPEGRFAAIARDGAPVRGYYRTSPRGWTYVTTMPSEPIVVAALRGRVGRVAAGALALLAVAAAAALWVARRIERPVLSLQQAAALMQAGQPVLPASTGIAEYDQVSAALADASRTIREAQDTMALQVEQAVERTRDAEERAANNRRVEALGRLTGGVAHDFNNLLGVISNSAHLIRRHAGGEALDKPVQATLNAVEAGRRLTENLLRFAGRRTVHPAMIDLAHFLPEAKELLTTVLGPRIALEISVAPETPQVAIDASELELALINLALNARDAMPRGGHVWLKARNAKPYETLRLPPQPFVIITFADDGPGMDESLVDHAFEPFVTTKPPEEGAGLGLSQVHGFCTQAGGVAQLDSTAGHGTTVSLLLPARVAAAARGPMRPRGAAATNLAGRRVLVVEDHRELGTITVDLLRTYGCEVERARSAAEALALLDAGQAFDVVLSDIVMPGELDGLALARRLRERQPAVPVVLTTGYSIAMAAAQDFPVLRKPCTPDALVDALDGAMRATAEPHA